MATSTVPARETRRGPNNILLKTVMAASGLFFVGYLLLHMYGNLQILFGRGAFDDYAHHLRVFGEGMVPENGVLWIARILLLASLVAHVWAGMVLWRRAGAARSTRYAGKRKTTYGSVYAKAMRWGGLAILLFVIFHILHFTTQTITLAGEHVSPAERVISSFQLWWAVLIYVVAMIAVGMHLVHGIYAACMTLGLNTTVKRGEQIRLISIAVTTLIVVGFLIPPFAILFGFVD
ncbi:succinate dehydrogenase cytochrome b subunit [Ornithinimicrobium pratense]|uniref:Succinate dehydrogenase cytochrome b subunit n=1 Tax=Ornithinimicrobium pratense TaxID=2593973 RepID=A0A5J6V349_9MICO|nr:succinate dehydrogenase cytochrome b subunit [Ornithinimicrobium pratense]QFG67716.1 succinate dehydrogenase cytochrome b subunit [Ornithinimicrobium pratense]